MKIIKHSQFIAGICRDPVIINVHQGDLEGLEVVRIFTLKLTSSPIAIQMTLPPALQFAISEGNLFSSNVQSSVFISTTGTPENTLPEAALTHSNVSRSYI